MVRRKIFLYKKFYSFGFWVTRFGLLRKYTYICCEHPNKTLDPKHTLTQSKNHPKKENPKPETRNPKPVPDLSGPHRRQNKLTGEWILVSPHRMNRPWKGKVEKVPAADRPAYDPGCYLCPGNQRSNGTVNPKYSDTYVFDNDFAALYLGEGESPGDSHELFQAQPEQGLCRVICFSPRHDLTLAHMDVPAIRRVVDLWTDQYEEIGAMPEINYVQIFENKGELMGCSNPHPHGQIWAQHTLPNEPAKELIHQKRYWDAHHQTLLQDYLEVELREGSRVVCSNDHFVTVVPYWALWPFETLVLPRRPVTSLLALGTEEKSSLAGILKDLTVRYDRLFDVSFPYSAGLHQAPTDGQPHPEWHFHIHFYPPLLRSATVKKFMVGYELLSEPQRDITAEESARRLRDV